VLLFISSVSCVERKAATACSVVVHLYRHCNHQQLTDQNGTINVITAMIRWLEPHEQHLARELAARCYASPRATYPHGLAADSTTWQVFLDPAVPQRRIMAILDSSGNLRCAVGCAGLAKIPAWLLSWVLSDLHSAEFMHCWNQAMSEICNYYESQQRLEFYTISPLSREAAWRRIMKPITARYQVHVERVVPANTTVDFPLYHSMMGHSTFGYDSKINRCVLRC